MKQIISAIGNIWNNLYSASMKIPFVFYMIFIALTVWITGPSLFPNWNSTYGGLILSYIVMMCVFYVFSRSSGEQDINISTGRGIPSFFIAFIVTWIFLTIIVKLNILNLPDFDKSLLIQTLIIQVCVVATAEELMFRGVIQNMLRKYGLTISLAIGIQALVFAFWHSWAYNITWYNLSMTDPSFFITMFIAFIFGVILGYIAEMPDWGIPATIGVHSAYNLCVLGALVLL